MSCLIANGRTEQCKDSISGLQAIYFVNFAITADDVTYSGTSPNFGDDIIGIAGGPTTDITSLYKYELKGANTFEQTIQSSRNREIKVKSRLPISILTDLDLKDRVIIRDKRYIINNLKINLTSAEVDLVLTNDFRKMIADEQPPLIPPIRPEPTPGCIRVYIPFIKNAVQATLSQCVTSVSGVTISPSTITQAQFVEICLPDNTDSTNYLITEEPSARIATEVDSEQFILDESGGLIVVYICITYTLSNGNTVANQIQISY